MKLFLLKCIQLGECENHDGDILHPDVYSMVNPPDLACGNR